MSNTIKVNWQYLADYYEESALNKATLVILIMKIHLDISNSTLSNVVPISQCWIGHNPQDLYT